jgi:hypothetical protein
MSHFVLVTLHLFAAIMFVGTVFFEIIILEGIRKPVGREAMRTVETAIDRRARRVMPFVVAALYGGGIAMARYYRDDLAHLFESSSRHCCRSRSRWRPVCWSTSSPH